VIGLAVLAASSRPLLAAESSVPFYEVGTLSRAVTTASPEAQKYFDQGLAFMFGFNHDEAIRSFQRAAELDPGCAMAYWGMALANGPHINNPVLPPTAPTPPGKRSAARRRPPRERARSRRR
jgi:hypothetical protein